MIFHFASFCVTFVEDHSVPVHQSYAQTFAGNGIQIFSEVLRRNLSIEIFDKGGCFPQISLLLFGHFIFKNASRKIHCKEGGEYSDINQAETETVFH